MSLLRNARRPGLGGALLARRAFLAVDCQPAMGAGPDADVVLVAPVDEVVTRLPAGPRMVGDLVGRQAGFLQRLLRRLVELRAQLLVGQDEITARMGGMEGRAG